MSHDDLRRAGFKHRTRVADARERLLAAVTPHDRTERLSLVDADGRALAEAVVAGRDVPGYDRAAMDGYAVRAEDTFGASGRSPSVLRLAARESEPENAETESGDARVNPGEAARVHTGSELPDGADAVVMVEQTEQIGDEVEVFDALAEGENVGDADEDVAEGQSLYDPGHRLRPSDLGLLKSVGVHEVETYERPRVAVIPTGEELVQRDPEPGEVVETNGLTVSKLVERWGGDASYRDVVTDDEDALRDAVESNLDHDVVVTTGGSSVGERDLTYEVVDELGEVFVHGVALKPGHPVALGVIEHSSIGSQNSKSSGDEVDGTAVVMLPGYPVACVINAVQFLRPALKRAGHLPDDPAPTREATLTRKVPSEPGVRTFARVRTEKSHEGREGLEATPTRASGSGILSSVALADGWVVVPEEREGLEEGATVAVENWEWSA